MTTEAKLFTIYITYENGSTMKFTKEFPDLEAAQQYFLGIMNSTKFFWPISSKAYNLAIVKSIEILS